MYGLKLFLGNQLRRVFDATEISYGINSNFGFVQGNTSTISPLARRKVSLRRN
jgi:hypothetical protein